MPIVILCLGFEQIVCTYDKGGMGQFEIHLFESGGARLQACILQSYFEMRFSA
jgi:hypothetical protein